MVTGVRPDSEYLILQKEQATAWGVHDTGATSHGIPLYEGDYGVALDDPFREQPIATGEINDTFIEQDSRTLGGPFRIPMWPEKAGTILDWAMVRTSDELDAYTATFVSPNIETARHFGLKVDTLRLQAAQNGDLIAAITPRGWYETKVNAGSGPSAPTMPSVEAFTFANARYLLSINDGVSEIKPIGVEDFSLEINNRLVSGPPEEDRADADKSMAISYLFAGKPELSGSITALWDRAAYGDMQRSKLKGSFRAVFAHKSGNSDVVGAGGAGLGTDASVPVADSSNFSLNEVVRFEDSTGVLKCAGKINDLPDGTHIQIASLEKNLVQGDLVYGKALSLYVSELRNSGVPKRRSRGEIVRVTLNFRAFAASGEELLSYLVEG